MRRVKTTENAALNFKIYPGCLYHELFFKNFTFKDLIARLHWFDEAKFGVFEQPHVHRCPPSYLFRQRVNMYRNHPK